MVRKSLVVLTVVMFASGVYGYEQYPGRRIYVNHVGYRPGAAKIAVAKGTKASEFEVFDVVTGRAAFKGKFEAKQGDFGTYLVGDFSGLKDAGRYEVRTGAERSVPFAISEDIYQGPIQKNVWYFSAQRCGPSTTGYHGPCHLDDGKRLDNGKHQDVTGGWHDACDLRKWVGPTLLGMIGLAKVAEVLKPNWDYGRIVEELRWGNRYFLSMQEPAGYVMSYCGGDDGNRWTNNKTGDEDDRPIHTEPASASVQFDFIAAEAMAARLTHKQDPIYADKCLRSAVKCLDYCRRKKIAKNALDLGAAIIACVELYKTSNDEQYGDIAAGYASRLLALQATGPIDEKTAVKGFFMTSAENTEPYKTMSRGCQYLIGLCELLENFPEYEDAPRWKKAIELYCSGYLSNMTKRNAFGIVPYGFYLEKQRGAKPIGTYWYRWFMGHKERPGGNVDFWWVGVNCNLASAGVGLIKASGILGRPELAAIAQRQLDWIVGCNPFNASTVTGVGYNQPKQFVTDEFEPVTPLISGAVMNGIGGTEDDMPALMPGKWQTCEYWTPMVCYTMWLMSEIQSE